MEERWLDTYVYDSFGNALNSTGSIANAYQYTGRDYNAETGLRYYRARYYDPTIGRFLSEDPLELGGADVNFYRYVYNSPLLLVDPSGWGAKGAGIGATIGGAVGWLFGGAGGAAGGAAGCTLVAPGVGTVACGVGGGYAGAAAGAAGGAVVGAAIGSFVEDHAQAIADSLNFLARETRTRRTPGSWKRFMR